MVSTLFYNGPILTVEDPFLIQNGFVAIEDGKIKDVGKYNEGELLPYDAKEVINLEGSLLMPGLINAHTHAAMTIFRGLADDLPLMEWLQNYIFPVEKQLTYEWVYTGSKLACIEMIRSGTTTFCDMYLFEDAVAKAVHDAGLRAVVGEVLYDFPSPNYGPSEKGLKYTEELIEKWSSHKLINIAVEPHALYTCSPDLLTKCRELALKYDTLLVVHLAETEREVDDVLKRYGRRPVEHLASLNMLLPNLLAAHVIHINDKEMELLYENGVKVVHNPESNMKLASGVSPINLMRKKGIVVSLGTDGAASNNDLDLFHEMDTAAKLHKVWDMDPTHLNAKEVIEMATINGAVALGIEDITGSIKKGKSADIIIVDFNKPHMRPVYDHISHIVYCAKGSDVTSVMVQGRWLMKDRELLSLNEDEIFDDINAISHEIKTLTTYKY